MPDEIRGSRTDARLIRAIAAAEVTALAEAYDRHSQFVYGAGLRLCGQRQAEAMTEEVFLALWNSPTSFVGPERSLRATLVADMRRRAVIFLRSQHSRQGAPAFDPTVAELELCVDEATDRG